MPNRFCFYFPTTEVATCSPRLPILFKCNYDADKSDALPDYYCELLSWWLKLRNVVEYDG